MQGINMRATREARNPNVQVVITHASHVCSQRSFGFPLTMNGMHRTQFNRARLDPLWLVIWSRVFWLSVTWHLLKAQRLSKIVMTFDRFIFVLYVKDEKAYMPDPFNPTLSSPGIHFLTSPW